jgi:uncharacterized membrane protein YheB (UPF0754 family)
LVQALLTIALGALAGGVTNSVAIWMLFHPYEPLRLWKWRLSFLQGAVPKNQPRLAAAIGRTVGGRLLTDADLAGTFREEGFRKAFDERLDHFLANVLHEERGSLREIIPPAALPEIERILEDAVEQGLGRLEEYLDSPAFEQMMERRAQDLFDTLREEPVGDLLTPAREATLTAAIDDWYSSAVESEEFEQAVDDYLDRAARRLLRPGRTFEEILPLGLVGSVERAIGEYLPLAIQRLGALLEDREARARFEALIHQLLHRFMGDLRFHQRVVARLIITEETVERVLDTVEAEGAEQISEMLRDPAVQNAMSRGVNTAIVDFLRRPVNSVLGEPEDQSVADARGTLVSWAVGVARDPATRAFLVEKLQKALERAGDRTWGDVFGRIPPERLAEWSVTLARSEPARKVYREASARLVEAVLERPIGKPSELFPEDAPRRIELAVGDPLWQWLQTQVPDVVRRIDVAGRVEDKVLHFPTQQMEALVRKVTDRELRLIVRLGYVLGAFIGTVLVVVDLLIP